MRFEHVSTYDAPPEAVHHMLVSREFRELVCAAVKSVEHSVDVTGTTVTVDQTQRVRKVPAFATKLVGETIRIHQVEEWTANDRAALHLTIPGKPGQLTGAITLMPDGGGTTYRVAGDLKVSIPLVGGKLEGVIDSLLHMFFTREHEVGKTWLADEG